MYRIEFYSKFRYAKLWTVTCQYSAHQCAVRSLSVTLSLNASNPYDPPVRWRICRGHGYRATRTNWTRSKQTHCKTKTETWFSDALLQWLSLDITTAYRCRPVLETEKEGRFRVQDDIDSLGSQGGPSAWWLYKRSPSRWFQNIVFTEAQSIYHILQCPFNTDCYYDLRARSRSHTPFFVICFQWFLTAYTNQALDEYLR